LLGFAITISVSDYSLTLTTQDVQHTKWHVAVIRPVLEYCTPVAYCYHPITNWTDWSIRKRAMGLYA